MRVVVTGGAGFLGSHVVDRFLRAGWKVLVIDDLSTGSPLNLWPEAEFVRADVCSPIDRLVAAWRPRVLVHLAAQVSVPSSVSEPGTDLTVNAGGTLNMLRAAATAKARKFIFVSSAAVYGGAHAQPVGEEATGPPLSPYAVSKWAAEQYVRLLGEQEGLPYTILRPSNIYGPRQTTRGEGAVVPSFLTRFLAGVDPVLHGAGDQVRDFIYVTDVAEAIFRSAGRRAAGTVLNISTGTPTSVRELWGLLAHLVGWGRPPVHGQSRPGDVATSVLANGRARRLLGWRPLVSLPDGLTETLRAFGGNRPTSVGEEGR